MTPYIFVGLRLGRIDPGTKGTKPPYGAGRGFRPVFRGFQPRPDSTRLRHPPPSLPNCGTAETDEIFRAVGAVLQHQVSPDKTRMGQDAGSDLCFEVSSRDRIAPDALEGLNRPHFWDSSLIAIFECHVCAQ